MLATRMDVLSILVGLMVSCLISPILSTNTTDVECYVKLPTTTSTPLEQVTVRVENIYDSLTNGVAYGPVTKSTQDIILQANSEIKMVLLEDDAQNKRRLSVAFDGYNVCASMIFLREAEACAEFGCTTTDPAKDCLQVCFRAELYGAKSSLDFFRSSKFSTSIGQWSTHNKLDIFSVEQITRHCFSQADYYFETGGIDPDIPTKSCRLGQRCRITSAFVQSTSNARYYIGCENEPGHLDGCEWEGCRSEVREQMPGSTTHYTFHKICRFCCKQAECNDVRRCSEGVCTELDYDNSSKDNSGASGATLWTFSSFVTISSALLYFL